MFDIIYLDDRRRPTVLASGLTVEVAATIARNEARSRRAGRMFGSGSERPTTGRIVLVVKSPRSPATSRPPV